MNGPEIRRVARQVIVSVASSIPGARVELVDPPLSSVHGFEVVISRGASRHILLCEVKSRAWPNELHAVAHRLARCALAYPSEACTPILMAPTFSPQSIASCAELNLCWADLSGNCELIIEGAYVKVRGLHNPYRQGRGTASLYSPKSARIVHALLLDPRRKWTTEELSRTAGVSFGQVANVKKLLERTDWIRASYGETVLTEPRRLLDDWSLHYSPRRKIVRLFTLEPPDQLEERINERLSDYAFAEFSSAQRYAPYTRHRRVALYVPHWDSEDAMALGLKGGDEAANVTIYETGDALAFVETLRGGRCVSPILTYLDLKSMAGRGQDTAEHLLESVIVQRWK